MGEVFPFENPRLFRKLVDWGFILVLSYTAAMQRGLLSVCSVYLHGIFPTRLFLCINIKTNM